MEPVDKFVRRSFLPLVLFLEDLEEIERTLKKDAKSIEIKTEDYKFSSISELSQHYSQNHKPKELEISSHDPYVSLRCNKLWAEISTTEYNQCELVFDKLVKELEKCRRRPYFAYSFWFTNFLQIIAFGFSLNAILGVLIAYAFRAIVIVWSLYVGYIRLRKTVEIIPVYKNSYESVFWPNLIKTVTKGVGSIAVMILVYCLTEGPPSWVKAIWEVSVRFLQENS